MTNNNQRDDMIGNDGLLLWQWMLEHIELTTGYIERYSSGICFSNNISVLLVGLVQSLVCSGPGVVYTTTLFMLNLQHM